MHSQLHRKSRGTLHFKFYTLHFSEGGSNGLRVPAKLCGSSFALSVSYEPPTNDVVDDAAFREFLRILIAKFEGVFSCQWPLVRHGLLQSERL